MPKRQAPRGRYDQIERQWRVLLALSDHDWYSVNEVADSVGAPRHRRTIMRDLETLSGIFPIERRREQVRSGLSEHQYRLRKPLRELLPA